MLYWIQKIVKIFVNFDKILTKFPAGIAETEVERLFAFLPAGLPPAAAARLGSLEDLGLELTPADAELQVGPAPG